MADQLSVIFDSRLNLGDITHSSEGGSMLLFTLSLKLQQVNRLDLDEFRPSQRERPAQVGPKGIEGGRVSTLMRLR